MSDGTILANVDDGTATDFISGNITGGVEWNPNKKLDLLKMNSPATPNRDLPDEKEIISPFPAPRRWRPPGRYLQARAFAPPGIIWTISTERRPADRGWYDVRRTGVAAPARNPGRMAR
jgi:hypothetical protein